MAKKTKGRLDIQPTMMPTRPSPCHFHAQCAVRKADFDRSTQE